MHYDNSPIQTTADLNDWTGRIIYDRINGVYIFNRRAMADLQQYLVDTGAIDDGERHSCPDCGFESCCAYNKAYHRIGILDAINEIAHGGGQFRTPENRLEDLSHPSCS